MVLGAVMFEHFRNLLLCRNGLPGALSVAFVNSSMATFGKGQFVQWGAKSTATGDVKPGKAIPGIAPVEAYCDIEGRFPSLEIAKRRVGIRRRITGCCARMISCKPRINPNVVYLFCQRYDLRPTSSQSCPFLGILKAVENVSGSSEQHQEESMMQV